VEVEEVAPGHCIAMKTSGAEPSPSQEEPLLLEEIRAETGWTRQTLFGSTPHVWVVLHTWVEPHATHAAPALPQAEAVVPVWQVLLKQQPVQFAALHVCVVPGVLGPGVSSSTPQPASVDSARTTTAKNLFMSSR
jgi:hypothetical protein